MTLPTLTRALTPRTVELGAVLFVRPLDKKPRSLKECLGRSSSPLASRASSASSRPRRSWTAGRTRTASSSPRRWASDGSTATSTVAFGSRRARRPACHGSSSTRCDRSTLARPRPGPPPAPERATHRPRRRADAPRLHAADPRNQVPDPRARPRVRPEGRAMRAGVRTTAIPRASDRERGGDEKARLRGEQSAGWALFAIVSRVELAVSTAGGAPDGKSCAGKHSTDQERNPRLEAGERKRSLCGCKQTGTVLAARALCTHPGYPAGGTRRRRRVAARVHAGRRLQTRRRHRLLARGVRRSCRRENPEQGNGRSYGCCSSYRHDAHLTRGGGRRDAPKA